LKQIVLEGGLTPDIRARVDEFCHILLGSRIVISGVHPANMVYAADENGRARFVLIDGYGERAFIPLTSLFPALNRRSKAADIEAFKAWLEGRSKHPGRRRR
jgi:hypothetical protein